MKSGGESLHLLLGIKNLNEGRKDKVTPTFNPEIPHQGQ
jgi:hypothetical protein